MGIGLGVIFAALVGYFVRQKLKAQPEAEGAEAQIEVICLWCRQVAATVSQPVLDNWEPRRCRSCPVTLSVVSPGRDGRWLAS